MTLQWGFFIAYELAGTEKTFPQSLHPVLSSFMKGVHMGLCHLVTLNYMENIYMFKSVFL